MTRPTDQAPELIEGLGQFRAGRGSIVTGWHHTREAALAEFQRLSTPRRDPDRDRAWCELRAKCPMRSKGKPVDDPAHLPLFVAVNEPQLDL